MRLWKQMVALATLLAILGLPQTQISAVTYVTDTGGYAYDQARAATNLAPAIALGTVAVAGIIAIAVNNSHEHSSSSSSRSSSSSSSHYSSAPYTYYYSCSSSSSSSHH